MVASTGTYLDTPFHRCAGATDVAGLPLQRLADLDGVVAPIGARQRAISRDAVAPYELKAERCWSTPAGTATGAPSATAPMALPHRCCRRLAGRGAGGTVGIDSVNIDDTSGLSRPAHTALLAAGIAMVEHLYGLDQLPPGGFRFHAAPPPVVGIGSFPVRAYAVLADG
jgi:arylformamidase